MRTFADWQKVEFHTLRILTEERWDGRFSLGERGKPAKNIPVAFDSLCCRRRNGRFN
jgi:hypothetical protein